MKRAGISEALHGLRLVNVKTARTPSGLVHRKPGDDDRPPPTPWPGRKVKPIAGQLDLDGNEVGAPRQHHQEGGTA